MSHDHLYCSTGDGSLLEIQILEQTPLAHETQSSHSTQNSDPAPTLQESTQHSDSARTSQDSTQHSDRKFCGLQTSPAAGTSRGNKRQKRTSSSTSCSPMKTMRSSPNALEDGNGENSEGSGQANERTEAKSDSPDSSFRPGITNAVKVLRVRRTGDVCEHTDVISYSNKLGRAYRFQVVCKTYGNSLKSLSLRRRVVDEFESKNYSYVAAAASPNKVFFATVES